ncbi:MarR family winged helix-turn-helix transcriptional regulator [Erwinia sp. V71]|uniref:MarR family winged helix-turn-helix transcriptional regulator n=1 Tax=Erwinia sp. V71 TaxID=3369424 RepID=UPI003F61AFCA
MNTRKADAVDAILEQWRRERPDLDASPMGPIGRLKRCTMLLEPRVEAAIALHGLAVWEFDMLATLRRSGEPYCLSPTALFSTLMVTSGTMTHRLKRLEERELIERKPNADDARSMLVQLTPKGVEVINKAVEDHVDNERKILSLLSPQTLAELDNALSLFMLELEKDSVTAKKR